MSFAGHVFDMINRSKQNRELLNLRRERAKGKKNSLGKGTMQVDPEITLEEYEKINRQLKQREEEQQKYVARTTLKIAVAMMVLILIIAGILKWFVL